MAPRRKLETTEAIGLRGWTLGMKDFGRVRDAAVQVAPFTILVGKNNSGKSYIASALWSLSWLYDLLSTNERTPFPKWYAEFSDGVTSSDSGLSIEVDAVRARSILNHVNQTLRSKSQQFLRNVFKYDGFASTILSIAPASLTTNLTVRVRKFSVTSSGEKSDTSDISIIDANGKSILTLGISDPARDTKFYVRYIYSALATTVLFGSRNPTWQAMYIPAARTGLMLAHKAIGGTRPVALGISGTREVTLPAPVLDFLDRTRIARLVVEGPGKQVADWLERAVLKGTVATTDTRDIFYRPADTKLDLPLYAASSMITELAPFLMLLKDEWASQEIIFEEPEAHLHLSAQRDLARALVRLRNAGKRIIITTHSDTFLQQINNLLALHSHPEREKLIARLGYSEVDLLNPSDVKAYEFVLEGNASSIRELERRDSGFAVDSLNDTIISLASETVLIQSDDEDEGKKR